ncbi:hypothetical protein D3C75_1175000 [compost metagenome]
MASRTKAVFAISELLSPKDAVGAVGKPVSAGLTVEAASFQTSQAGAAKVPAPHALRQPSLLN